MKIANSVCTVRGIPKKIHERMAVNSSSKALAKVFKIEFNFWKRWSETVE